MLTRAVASYLEVRRALGFRLLVQERLLRSFTRFAAAREEVHVRAQTAIDWAGLGTSAAQRARRLETVFQFARHVRAEDDAHELPPVGVFGPARRPRRPPFIFAPADVGRLLAAASRLGPSGSLRPHTYRTLFALLAATGLRISEALGLRFDDVTPDGLVIRETKFRKHRLVPLHDSAVVAVDHYLAQRRNVGGCDSHVFVSGRGRPFAYITVANTFQTLLRAIGLLPGPGGRTARLHDLRHTFAVRALEACPRDRDRITRHMLALSTYLGHSHVAHTYWYLEATPHLMADISAACEALIAGGTS